MEKHPARAKNPQMTPESGDRILEVFKHMVRDDEVKRGVGKRR
jgi:hypothetical protein